jgi:hypothetical protein
VLETLLAASRCGVRAMTDITLPEEIHVENAYMVEYLSEVPAETEVTLVVWVDGVAVQHSGPLEDIDLHIKWLLSLFPWKAFYLARTA